MTEYDTIIYSSMSTASAAASTDDTRKGAAKASAARLVEDVPSDLVASIRSRLCAITEEEAPFEPSLIYVTKTKEKYEDATKRSSFFRELKDDGIWKLCENVVRHISESDAKMDYALVRNDATHLKYQPGGFFKTHQDYLSFTSNCVEEYTLLIAVNSAEAAATVVGGATRIYFNAGDKKQHDSGSIMNYFKPEVVTAAYDVTAPGTALLFRKDLDHEGELVKAGEKQLLSLNLLGYRRRESSQVLLLQCTHREATATTASSSSSAAAAGAEPDSKRARLIATATEPTIKAIFVDELCGMLCARVDFANSAAERAGESPPSIIEFRCPAEFSLAAVDTVFKILRRMHVTAADVEEHAAAIDYFGPFDRASLLVDLAVPPSEAPTGSAAAGDSSAAASDAAIGRGGSAAASAPTAASAAADDDEGQNDDVICCDSEARTKAVALVAARLGMPYVPFRMVFAEGTMAVGGEASFDKPFTTVEVQPVWTSIGDYDNIFSMTNLEASYIAPDRYSMEELHKSEIEDVHDRSPNADTPIGAKVNPDVSAFGDDGETIQHNAFRLMVGSMVGMNVPKCLISSHALSKELIKLPGGDDFLDGRNDDEDDDDDDDDDAAMGGAANEMRAPVDYATESRTQTKPNCQSVVDAIAAADATITSLRSKKDGANDEGGADDSSSSSSKKKPPLMSLFHRDSHGKTCFSAEEAEAASEHIAAMYLDRRVEACIQHQRFELPQQSGYVSAQFCNESVQGSLNLLEITGVVKLDINDRWTFDRRKATSLALPRMSARVWPGPRGVVNDFEAYY